MILEMPKGMIWLRKDNYEDKGVVEVGAVGRDTEL